MTEPNVGVTNSGIKGAEKRSAAEQFSQDLITLLGGEAAQAALLATRIDTMSPRNRMHAMLALSSLVIALEQAEGEPVDLRLLVEEQLSRRRLHAVEPTPEIPVATVPESVEVIETQEPDTDAEESVLMPPEPREIVEETTDQSDTVAVDFDTQRDVAPSHEEDAPASQNAVDFAKKLFGDDRADSLTVGQISQLVEITEKLYLPKNNKHEIALQQVERLKLYLDGFKDSHIAKLANITPTGVRLGRNKLMIIIHREYSPEVLEAAADMLFSGDSATTWLEPVGGYTKDTKAGAEPKPIDVAEVAEVELDDEVAEEPTLADLVEIEVPLDELTDGEIFDRAADVQPVAEPTAEQQTIEELKGTVLTQVLELWGAEVAASMGAILRESDIDPDATQAREQLKALMLAYAPRWQRIRGFPFSQDNWNAMANIIGLDNLATKTIATYQRQHNLQLRYVGTSAMESFLAVSNYLIGSKLAGAPEVPQPHHAQNGARRSFKKGRSK